MASLFSNMSSKKLSRSDYFVIAANLLPIVGVWAWGWDPKEIFLVYCLETIIIGVFTLIKMGVVTLVRKNDNWYTEGNKTRQPGLFFMLFFLVHYGFFVGIQMSIFFAVSGIGKGTTLNIFSFFYKWPSLLSIDSLILLAVFVVSYLVKFITDFILTKEYKTVPLMKLMFQPYGRIFVQQFAVIFGSMFLSFGAGKIFICIFALVKIMFEVFANYDAILEKGMKEAEEGSGKK